MDQYKQRYSSMSKAEGRLGQSEPKTIEERDKMASLIGCIEGAFQKLEESIDIQNGKMRKFQNKVAVALMEKFDKLLEIVSGLAEGVGKLVDHRATIRISEPRERLQSRAKLPPVHDRESRERIHKIVKQQRSDRMPDFVDPKRLKLLQIQEINRSAGWHPEPLHSSRSNVAPTIHVMSFNEGDSGAVGQLTKPSSVNQNRAESFPVTNRPTTSLSIRAKIESDPALIPQYNIPAEIQAIQRNLAKELRMVTTPEEENFILIRNTGQFYNALTHLSFEGYSSGKVSYEDMKIKFSWNIVNRGYQLHQLYLEKYLGASPSVQVTRAMQVAELLDQSSKASLEYLMDKYPQSRGKIADSELCKRIKEMNKSDEIGYDLITNVGMSFSAPSSKSDFSREIKLFLNKLISETKVQYQGFRRTMEEVFTPMTNGYRMVEVEYLIGSKIKLETPEYTAEELEAPGLQLKSPAMVRIVLKWMESLSTIFDSVQTRVLDNRVGFKSVLKGPSINLARKRKEVLANHIKRLKKERLAPLQDSLHKGAYEVMINLFQLVSTDYKGSQYLDHRQVLVANLAEYFSECMETSVFQYCNGLLQELNAIKDSYSEGELESQIDMISFGVMDLLRCKCIGSKEQILRIYEQLKHNTDYFEIIRVKNKLNEGTRDILINLKLKNSFLICEVQLALGKSQEEVNDHFCHFLYELQRSRFAVNVEAAYSIVSIDPRNRYFQRRRNVIKFLGETEGDSLKLEVHNQNIMCSKSHPPMIMTYQKNDRPICCNSCSNYFSSYQTCLEFMKCSECLRNVCPVCLTKGLRKKELAAHFARYIQLDVFMKFIGKDPNYLGFCNLDDIKVKIEEILQKYKYAMLNVFDRDTHKIRFVKIQEGLIVDSFGSLNDFKQDQIHDSNFNGCVLFGVHDAKVVSLESIRYHQKYHSRLDWGDLEVILEKNNIKDVVAIVRDSPVKEALIIDAVESSEKILCVRRMKQLQRLMEQEGNRQQPCIDLSSKALKNINVVKLMNNKDLVKICNLSENQLQNINQIAAFTSLQELYVSDNLVRTLEGVNRLESLMQLNLQNNELSGDIPSLNMPKLRYIDLSHNKITCLNEFANSLFPNLLQLDISHNHIEELPIFRESVLEVYNFSHNHIKILDQGKTSMPELTHIYGSHNEIAGVMTLALSKRVKVIILNYNHIVGKQVSAEESLVISNDAYYYFEVLHMEGNAYQQEIPVLKLPFVYSYNMRNNKIPNVDNLRHWELPMIYDIDFSINLIDRLPPINLPSLVILRISNNRITNIDALKQSDLSGLELLDISHNLIEGELPVVKLRSLKTLNLEHNRISSIINLGDCRLPNLVTLKLSHNSIVGCMPIVYMQRIKTVELDWNRITSLDCLNEMQAVPNLDLISLHGNHPEMASYQRIMPRDPLELVCQFYREQFKREGRLLDTSTNHHRVQQQFYCQ